MGVSAASAAATANAHFGFFFRPGLLAADVSSCSSSTSESTYARLSVCSTAQQRGRTSCDSLRVRVFGPAMGMLT
jgi:hypothetical protein